MGKIFLSYRRADTAATAGRIYDHLAAKYGKEAVFKDVDSVPPGVDFHEFIEDAIAQSDVVLVLIGQGWLGITDGTGHRRLEYAQDPVRFEIETAMQFEVSIVPLLVDNAEMPKEDQLPSGLQALASRNAIAVRYDPDFEHDMHRMFSAVDYLKSAAEEKRTEALEAARREAARQEALQEAKEFEASRQRALEKVVNLEVTRQEAAYSTQLPLAIASATLIVCTSRQRQLLVFS